jgi:alcohol dehydrogenase class IV
MTAPKYFIWDYRSVVEVGSGCRTFVPQRFEQMGCKRVALITDPGIVKAGIVDLVKGVFDAQGSPKVIGVYDKIEQDAAMRVINDCARWCRENAADGLLAVGGGSVLDSVKGVKAMLGMKVTDIKEIMPGNIGPYFNTMGKPLGVPHIAVATTAGTGSESSPVAVIYNEDDKVKGDFLHPYIPADYAFLDPDLTVGLPPKMTADTGFDALSHAVEAISSPSDNCMIDALSLQAIRLIRKYLPVAVKDGKNLEARTKMLVASNMAIMSFSMSGLFYPIHNVAHAAGGQLRIPHGEANAVLIPILMEEYPWHYLPNAETMAEAFGVRKDGMKPEAMIAASAEAVRALQKQCGVKQVFTQKLDQAGKDAMFFAVKYDPSGVFYPLPDKIIRNCIERSFEH